MTKYFVLTRADGATVHAYTRQWTRVGVYLWKEEKKKHTYHREISTVFSDPNLRSLIVNNQSWSHFYCDHIFPFHRQVSISTSVNQICPKRSQRGKTSVPSNQFSEFLSACLLYQNLERLFRHTRRGDEEEEERRAFLCIRPGGRNETIDLHVTPGHKKERRSSYTHQMHRSP